MSYKIIQIIAPNKCQEQIKKHAEDNNALQNWQSQTTARGLLEYNILIPSQNAERLTDKLQPLLSKKKYYHITTSSIESLIPRPTEQSAQEDVKKLSGEKIPREALYEQIKHGTKINIDYFILVILSTIVAAIGIINDNLAIVIAAMVIAPLLGPNLALSFGVSLGDKNIIRDALKANAVGFGITLAISILLGLTIPSDSYFQSTEYMARMDVGFSAVILALASGAAAVLSLTSGVSSAMVGVMVAVAMMPPAVVLGLNIGSLQIEESYKAGLLLAINIICVNLSAKTVFMFKGVKPRTWYQKKKSEQSVRLSLSILILLLAILSILIFLL